MVARMGRTRVPATRGPPVAVRGDDGAMTRWQRIARESVGRDYAARYAERFRAMAEGGDDVHGEAAFVAGLVPAPARVLDAGRGTGRAAIRLDQLGYDVAGLGGDPPTLAGGPRGRADPP